MIETFKIPVPPIQIQKEIVKILDSFTQLEAELEARKNQYEYYRTQLLTFENKGGYSGLTLVRLLKKTSAEVHHRKQLQVIGMGAFRGLLLEIFQLKVTILIQQGIILPMKD